MILHPTEDNNLTPIPTIKIHLPPPTQLNNNSEEDQLHLLIQQLEVDINKVKVNNL